MNPHNTPNNTYPTYSQSEAGPSARSAFPQNITTPPPVPSFPTAPDMLYGQQGPSTPLQYAPQVAFSNFPDTPASYYAMSQAEQADEVAEDPTYDENMHYPNFNEVHLNVEAVHQGRGECRFIERPSILPGTSVPLAHLTPRQRRVLRTFTHLKDRLHRARQAPHQHFLQMRDILAAAGGQVMQGFNPAQRAAMLRDILPPPTTGLTRPQRPPRVPQAPTFTLDPFQEGAAYLNASVPPSEVNVPLTRNARPAQAAQPAPVTPTAQAPPATMPMHFPLQDTTMTEAERFAHLALHDPSALLDESKSV